MLVAITIASTEPLRIVIRALVLQDRGGIVISGASFAHGCGA
jgi:hypothetical protein